MGATSTGPTTLEPIMVPLANARRERMAQLLAAGRSPDEAHREAGFTGTTSRAARHMASQLDVRARVVGLQTKAEVHTVAAVAVTRHELIESLRETRDMAREGAPVLSKDGQIAKDESGKELRKPDLSAKTNADRTLMDIMGFKQAPAVNESKADDIKDKSPEEQRDIVYALIEEIDPNFVKQLENRIREELAAEMGLAGTEQLQ